MARTFFLLYGLFSYLIFLGVYAWMACFVGNFIVPVTLDGPREGSLAVALAVDLGLVLLFGVQHSVMARPWFKHWLTRYIPHAIERSTYVLASCVCVILLLLLWQPIGGSVWDVQAQPWRGILWGLFALGWLAVPVVTLMLSHFDLFGLRQTWLAFRGKPYHFLTFRTPLAYRLVRHPIYVAWIVAFWATPTMSVSHLVFAAGLTVYILLAIPLEERDLITYHGEAYIAYRKQVGALLPMPGRIAKPTGAVDTAAQQA